jgi:hypothetical protein
MSRESLLEQRITFSAILFCSRKDLTKEFTVTHREVNCRAPRDALRARSETKEEQLMRRLTDREIVLWPRRRTAVTQRLWAAVRVKPRLSKLCFGHSARAVSIQWSKPSQLVRLHFWAEQATTNQSLKISFIIKLYLIL